MADDAKLIAVLEANTKQMENALKRVEGVLKGSTDRMTASVKKLDQQVGLVGQSFGRLGKALTFTAAIAAAKQLASAFSAVVDRADSLVDTADKLGITTASLKALRYAAEQAGSSASQMDEALAKLSKGLAEARAGTGDLRKLLIANGMKEAEIQSLTLEKALAKVADLIHGSTDASNAAKVAMLAFGRGNDELAVTFKDGAIAISGYTDEFKRLHTEISEEGERKLASYKDELTRLNSQWDAAVDHMTLYALTAMEKMGQVAQAAYEHVNKVASQAATSTESSAIQDLVKQRASIQAAIDAQPAHPSGFAKEYKQNLIDSLLPLDAEIDKRTKALNQRLYNEMEIQRAAARGYGSKVPADYISTPKPTQVPVTPPKKAGKTKTGIQLEEITSKRGIKARLAKDWAPQFQAMVDYLEAMGYDITNFGEGGYSGIRKTRGPGTKGGISQHSYGRALDINPQINKFRSPLTTNLPPNMAQIAEMFGIEWGGTWKIPDAMHFVGKKKLTLEQMNAGVLATGNVEEQTKAIADENERAAKAALDHADAWRDALDTITNANQALKRDVVGGLIKDLERGVKPAEAFANALMKISDALLDRALNAIFPDVGGAIFGAALAGGGVMTGRGPMPLRKYAGGGVAHSPQVALFGEGHGAEAFVPLPDGRRIPVNIRVPGMGGLGGGRGGQGVAVHNRVTVDASPLFVVTTHEIARQAGHTAVAEAGDQSRRRPGGR